MSRQSIYILTEGVPAKIKSYTPEYHIAMTWQLSSTKERVRDFEEIEEFNYNSRID